MAPKPKIDDAKDAIRTIVRDLNQGVGFRKRLDAYRTVFEKTDRILSGRPLVVVMAEAKAANLDHAPAWTDGETIFLNGPQLQRDLNALRGNDISPLVMSLKGVNYHELAHVLYSPRIADDISKMIVKRAQDDNDFRWWYSYNALEDQRIETWFTATYSPASRYFEAIALKWLVTHQNVLTEAHILVHGRKFLSPEVRYASRKAFAGKYGDDLADKFEDVIDRYLNVALPQDTNRAFMLVKEYKELLDAAMMVNPPDLLSDDNNAKEIPNKGNQRDDLIKKGRATNKEQKRARSVVKPYLDRAKEADDALRQGDHGEGEGEGEEAEGSGEGQGQGDGPKSNVDNGSKGQTGKAGRGVSTAQGDSIRNSPGTPGAKAPDLNDPVEDAINQAVDKMYEDLEEALNDPQLLEDVKATARAIRAAGGGLGEATGKYGSYSEQSISGAHKPIVRRMIHTLEQLRTDLEPTWLRRQVKGRVDIKRTMTRKPWEMDFFTQWDEGSEEAAGLEAVVLVDLSASMSGLIGQASEALWTLKRTFDSLEIRTTVLGYSDSHVILYRPGDKSHPGHYRQFNTHNSTNPTTALQEALQILSSTRQQNRLLITITDGQWGGHDQMILGTVRAIQKLGTLTVLLGLDGAVRSYGKHGHEVGHDIASIKQMPEIATKIVAGIMRRAATRV